MTKQSILFAAISILIMSCKDKNANFEKKITKQNYTIGIAGHTFFKVTETDSGKILYKPCGANIEKYIIYDDSIFHNLGQEHYKMNINSAKKIENYIIYRTVYKYNNEIPEDGDSLIKLVPMDKTQKFWKINNEIFIDSIFLNNLQIVKELPCDEDCYDCPKQNIVKEECILNNLSDKLNFKLVTEYDKSNDDNPDPWKANIIITQKRNNSILENIEFIPDSWALFSSIQCNIISVADYNFDGLDDFTIMLDVGGNSGPTFSYFFQNEENKFVKDKTFKFQDGSLPNKIDAKNKSLTFGSEIFQLKNNKWEKTN